MNINKNSLCSYHKEIMVECTRIMLKDYSSNVITRFFGMLYDLLTNIKQSPNKPEYMIIYSIGDFL